MTTANDGAPAPSDEVMAAPVDVTLLLPDQPETSLHAASAEDIPAAAGHARIEHLAAEILPALIARLGVSALGEMEIRQDGWRVRLRRAPAGDDATGGERGRTPAGRRGDASAVDARPGASGVAGRPLVAVGPGEGTRAGRDGTGARSDGRVIAHSPAVGYYARRDPIGVGHPVRAGDVIGHVDVLGVRHEVVSPADGVVGRLLAEQGEAVEYGQELVRIDAVGRGADRARGTSG